MASGGGVVSTGNNSKPHRFTELRRYSEGGYVLSITPSVCCPSSPLWGESDRGQQSDTHTTSTSENSKCASPSRLLRAVPHVGRQTYDNVMDSSPTCFHQDGGSPRYIAMDTQASVQVDVTDMSRLPPRWTPVLKSLQGDVEHWLDNNPDMTGYGRPSHLTGVGEYLLICRHQSDGS
ncbi:unnamed protein product [Phytophthora fragariaefolia]|uniref:Unnamed protein product n=1 Tax=Phytophthora fragariaefolia TaxID=1490495 RepID=A0A9W7D706_9STRA|nr:unnamed protein product [Phytophthora fragariaefolia]